MTNIVEHKINTGDANPINSAPYRCSPKEREAIREQISKMLKDRIIQPSTSPWASPVVLIPKPDGSLRFCIDYRKLNDLTIKDVYPLPRIDDSLAALGTGRFFSSFDLTSGYWQVKVAEGDREKTAFISECGLFEFNVMPFGLCSAPAIFQRLMDAVLAGLKWRNLLVYLDDIIVFSDSFDKQLLDVKEMFLRINGRTRIKRVLIPSNNY